MPALIDLDEPKGLWHKFEAIAIQLSEKCELLCGEQQVCGRASCGNFAEDLWGKWETFYDDYLGRFDTCMDDTCGNEDIWEARISDIIHKQNALRTNCVSACETAAETVSNFCTKQCGTYSHMMNKLSPDQQAILQQYIDKNVAVETAKDVDGRHKKMTLGSDELLLQQEIDLNKFKMMNKKQLKEIQEVLNKHNLKLPYPLISKVQQKLLQQEKQKYEAIKKKYADRPYKYDPALANERKEFWMNRMKAIEAEESERIKWQSFVKEYKHSRNIKEIANTPEQIDDMKSEYNPWSAKYNEKTQELARKKKEWETDQEKRNIMQLLSEYRGRMRITVDEIQKQIKDPEQQNYHVKNLCNIYKKRYGATAHIDPDLVVDAVDMYYYVKFDQMPAVHVEIPITVQHVQRTSKINQALNMLDKSSALKKMDDNMYDSYLYDIGYGAKEDLAFDSYEYDAISDKGVISGISAMAVVIALLSMFILCICSFAFGAVSGYIFNGYKGNKTSKVFIDDENDELC